MGATYDFNWSMSGSPIMFKISSLLEAEKKKCIHSFKKGKRLYYMKTIANDIMPKTRYNFGFRILYHSVITAKSVSMFYFFQINPQG